MCNHKTFAKCGRPRQGKIIFFCVHLVWFIEPAHSSSESVKFSIYGSLHPSTRRRGRLPITIIPGTRRVCTIKLLLGVKGKIAARSATKSILRAKTPTR